MISRRWFLYLAVGATVLAVPSLGFSAERSTERPQANKPAVERETVEMFQAMKDGVIDVKFIAKDMTAARIIITNKTKKPLSIKLPEAFAGVPVLAQRGGGGFGGGGRGGGGRGGGLGGGGGGQGLGGGLGGGGGGFGGGGGGRGGGGGGFFNIAPEKVGNIKVACLCLDHGMPDPTPRMKYEIKPIDTYVNRPAVVELVKAFGNGQLPHGAAQAAVWHLNNDISWEELAALRTGSERLLRRPSYFNEQDLRGGTVIAAEALRRAQAIESKGDYEKGDSLSKQ